jgi:hypothetical protein
VQMAIAPVVDTISRYVETARGAVADRLPGMYRNLRAASSLVSKDWPARVRGAFDEARE